jgi:hypothetical protein
VPVVAFLGLLWAAVLIPVGYKAVAARRARFASSFGDGLQALEHAEGFFATLDAPSAERAPARQPRSQSPSTDPARALSGGAGGVNAALLRSVLAGLLIAVVVSLLLAVVTAERPMLAVNLALDDCLLAFVALIVHRRDTRSLALRRVGLAVPEAVELEIEPPALRRVDTPAYRSLPRRLPARSVPLSPAPAEPYFGHR